MEKKSRDLIINRKARHDYHILETFEAGIALSGTEVKSLREGKGNLKDSFARIENGEIFLYNMHISPYEKGNIYNKDPLRPRKLLMHKKEINRLLSKVKEKGLTLVPLRLYLNERGLVKVELALAKGKALYDKREDARQKDASREIEKAFKEFNKV
ncbi:MULTISPECIES: SsrA-binding protein SmpB [Tepidanaerobacter]|uniref:SsrA-binding protein n=1 Tax=Tepidanaerobacter syntrophicus TaxID=224999 RepID=A0A0U9HJI6_9FIRM|nr:MULTISPECIES: SsrA-binding protein SmpB [Tepidanaerobacter]GAQ24191.1 SsrA-binding protein [Tepidanaerobacter syntrophicus]GLI18472.1 SsrA-binding protein [Tepidanaerobacter syntrophicus]GLI49966.1 SsrA-binding protein [Tepidanaerobacter syntrophicus]HHV83040.1 SsrA-binding protein SmpB [Tepidanaerobacter syntrophicus]